MSESYKTDGSYRLEFQHTRAVGKPLDQTCIVDACDKFGKNRLSNTQKSKV